MRLFLSPTQDATIYQRYPTLNSGLDEIVEVGKIVKNLDGSGMYASASTRTLIHFDIPSLQQYPVTSKYFLNLRIANATNVNRYQKLEVYPISSSWVEGSGYFYQDVENSQDGVTWETGSIYSTDISASYTVSTLPIQDIKIDVTSLIAPVVAGSNITPWNGLLIKFPTLDENDSTNKGNIKFFSSNTHTVFSPKLEIVYVDQSFVTASLKPILDRELSIIPKNLKEVYTIGEVSNVHLVVRDKFPDKRFDATQRYRPQYYLPSSSYFRIRDAASGHIIYDFDQYSALNCDNSGSYFILDTSALEINRYYTIDLKVQNGTKVFFPPFNYEFKVDIDV
jgi:hypothetical protein